MLLVEKNHRKFVFFIHYNYKSFTVIYRDINALAVRVFYVKLRILMVLVKIKSYLKNRIFSS